MFSPEYWQVRATLVNDRATLGVPLAVQRQEWEDGVAGVALPEGVTTELAAPGDIPGEWVRGAAAEGDAAVLLVHGGGFSAGSCRTHRELAARLSLASGVPVLTFDYRLAPEHPFPAALDDTVAAYRALLAQGIAPTRLVIAGDSASGGVAVLALGRPCDEGREHRDTCRRRPAVLARKPGARGKYLPGWRGCARPAGITSICRPGRPAAAAHPRW